MNRRRLRRVVIGLLIAAYGVHDLLHLSPALLRGGPPATLAAAGLGTAIAAFLAVGGGGAAVGHRWGMWLLCIGACFDIAWRLIGQCPTFLAVAVLRVPLPLPPGAARVDAVHAGSIFLWLRLLGSVAGAVVSAAVVYWSRGELARRDEGGVAAGEPHA